MIPNSKHLPARRTNSPARQRGAIGFFGMLTLLLALMFTALAVDAGRLWFEKRELQAVADLAAIEAARSLGCGGVPGNAMAAAQAAATRNGFAGNLAAAPNLVELGGISTAAGIRQFNAGAASQAAHVVATKSVPASLVLGGMFGQNTLISAEATARAEPSHASFSVGSYLLRVNTTSEDAWLLNGLLGGLLGGSLSLDAVSYQGLASSDVTLEQLLRAKGTVGSADELLNADLSVAEVISLTATAVGQQSAATAGLQGLAAVANQASVKLGDVLDVSVPASDAAGKASINVLDLITTTLLVANQNHAVAMPDLAINLGGLLTVHSTVNVIEPPQIAVGPPGPNAAGGWCTQASTAQISVNASVQGNVTVLGTGVVIDLGLLAAVAQGEAHLTNLGTVAGDTRATIGATPGVASMTLTGSSGAGSANISVVALGVPVPAATVGLNLPIQQAGATDLIYQVSSPVADNLPLRQSVGGIGDSMSNALADPGAISVQVLPDLGLLTGLVNGLVAPISSTVLNPLLGFIGSSLLDPLFKALGLQLGGLDVTLEDIEYTGGGQLVI